MPPKNLRSEMTPSNTVCSDGHKAGWGTDGNVHCFNPSNSGNTSTYPTSSSYGGGTQGGGHSSGGGHSGGRSYSSPEQNIQQVCASLGNNVLGGAYHDQRKDRDKFGDGINYQVKNIISQLNYYGFKDPKGIVLSDCALVDIDTYTLHQAIQYQPLNLTVLDLSNNCLGLNSVHTIFYGFKGHQIKSINLANNWLGDDSALFISQALEYGNIPALKHIDVSGNNMSWESNAHFAKASKNIRQDIKILINKVIPIDTIINGVKNQSDLFFGSKEEKHAVIKNYLMHAQSNGVDVQNVAVSKSIFDKIINSTKLYFNFYAGFAKCNIVPEDTTSFAAGVIIAKVSKKATGFLTATDGLACYFEVFDTTAPSQEGLQFMLDAGIVNTTDLLGNVE